MSQEIVTLRAQIAALQKELQILQEQDTNTQATLLKNFDATTLKQHKAQRIPTFAYLKNLPILVHISGPLVYAMIFPTAFLDLSLIIYQAICFRVWKVERVKRKNFIAIDRHHLAYLNAFEKINCVYCGYTNGVYAFAVEVAARTEKHWCPIKHASKTRTPHALYDEFVEFGDLENWKNHPARKTLPTEDKPKA